MKAFEAPSTTDSEKGATLIELLMGIVLTGVILTGLTGGIMTYFRAADGIGRLLKATPELQLAATRFGTDIQSATSVTQPATNPAVPACGSLPPGAGSTTLLEVGWTDPGALPAVSDDQEMKVSYTYAPATHQLRRTACKAASVVQQTTLISHIQPLQTPQILTPATNQWDLALWICTATSAGSCVDSVIPATLTGVRRSS